MTFDKLLELNRAYNVWATAIRDWEFKSAYNAMHSRSRSTTAFKQITTEIADRAIEALTDLRKALDAGK